MIKKKYKPQYKSEITGEWCDITGYNGPPLEGFSELPVSKIFVDWLYQRCKTHAQIPRDYIEYKDIRLKEVIS